MPIELSSRQATFWTSERAPLPLAGTSPLFYLELESSGLELDRLESAWSRVVAAHPELCMVVNEHGHFEAMGGRYATPMRQIDLRGEDDQPALLAEVRRLILEENLWLRQRPCRLSATLLGEGKVRLHLQFNSARVDPFSVMHLLRDWQISYAAAEPRGCSGSHSVGDSQLEKSPAASLDERRLLPERSRAFWEKRERSLAPPPELPMLQPARAAGQPSYDRLEHTLSPAIAQELAARSQEEGISLASALISAYASVIAAWSAEPRFALAVNSYDRSDAPHRGAQIGDGCSVALLTVESASEITFGARARHLHLAQTVAHTHRFEGVLTAARRAPGGHGVPVVFTDLLSEVSGAEGLQSASSWLGPVQLVRSRTPQIWLDCQARSEGGSLVLSWDFPRGLFDDSTLREMFDAFISLVGDLANETTWQVGTAWLSHQLLPALQRSALARRRSLLTNLELAGGRARSG